MNSLRNIEAEQIVLGCILHRNDLLFKLTFLRADHFAEQTHQRIFERISEGIQKGQELNPVTLKGSLSEFKQDGFDPDNYLLVLTGKAGSLNVVQYANIVKELAEKRRIAEILEEKLAQISSEKKPNDLIEELNKSFAEMHSNSSQYRMVSFREVMSEIARECQEKKAPSTPTGLSRIDRTMGGGMERGKTYCIAARPKDGKTMLKGTVANNLRKQGVPFLFIAAEMGRKEIAKRMVGSEIGSASRDINEHNKLAIDYITEESMKKGDNMFFVDAPRINLHALGSIVASAVRTKKIEGFVLDYLQLVTGKDPRDTIAQHQENVAQTIAEICKRENIWCLYSCQVNREGEIRNGDGIMMATDWLYEINRCGDTEQDLDKIWLKHLATRNLRPTDIGSQMYPSYEVVRNGTHFMEVNN